MIKAVIFDLNGIFIRGINSGLESEESPRLSVQEFVSKYKKENKISEDMINFAKKLKEKGVKVFILSNMIKELAEDSHYCSLLNAVDKVYFSFETGFKKPDLRAWENVLRENKLTPHECIYFDDQDKHVRACEVLGIKSFLFTTEEDFEKKIKELDIVSLDG